jgi:hypothetical protein
MSLDTEPTTGNGRGQDQRGRQPARRPQGAATANGDRRPEVRVTTEEHLVNDAATAALASDPDQNQRGGLLVRVVADDASAAGHVRRPSGARIEPLTQPTLRERLSAAARWVQMVNTRDGSAERPARPPAWCVAAVHARGKWNGVRRLEAVVDHPVLRPDGSVLDRPGYDADTGLYYHPAGAAPGALAGAPTKADAAAARDALLEVVHDVPFAADHHRAAWLAALLTPLARFAFRGPAPLFLVDANVRGAGKGLLCDAAGLIVTGRRFSVCDYTNDRDELRKRITALALQGERLVLFDNLEGRFGNGTLDAALTADTWEDRVLGVNRTVRLPLFVTWFATGNNVAVGADTARRVCHVRLECSEEHPERRAGFRHPDLLAWVEANRPPLLAAALTVLRAYCAAGRPDLGLAPWGSFTGWSALIRGAVVWCGLPDPAAGRLELQERSDATAEAMGALLAGWLRLDPHRRGLTAGEVVERVYKRPPDQAEDWHADLRAALDVLLPRPDGRLLGYTLRSHRKRVFKGLFLAHTGGSDRNGTRWAVYPAAEFSAGGRPASEPSPPSPRLHRPEGGDGEMVEMVHPKPESETAPVRDWEEGAA